ncbi:MAG: prepilin-type N-terminal cleavage/methylation domain-containing protein [Armatimonadota bacterium]
METRCLKCGFTLWELLMVVAIVLILASILFPMFSRTHHHNSRVPTCTSNVRQLSTAVQMYNQDNQSRYPGKNWADAVLTYVGSQKIYFCPSDAGVDKTQPISYGYNGLLVRVNGTGLNEGPISYPSEIGAICDATPSRPFAEGGVLIGGGAMVSAADNLIGTPMPRHTGVVVGYCDGHAKYFPGKKPEMKDINNPISRAFYQVLGYGLMPNYGGGQRALATNPTVGKQTITLGGDFAGMPLALAAADVWAQLGGKWFIGKFTGSADAARLIRARSGEYCWVIADGSPLKPNEIEIARDALVIIVSKNTKLTAVTNNNFALTTSAIAGLFHDDQGFFTPETPATAASARVAYTYNQFSGNRNYFQQYIMGSLGIGYNASLVADDLEMVEKVAGNPYGIGYCSSVFADPDKVRILDIIPAAGGAPLHYPNPNPKYASVVPDSYTDANYPFIRPIKVQFNASKESRAFIHIFRDPNYLQGPLFMTGYFRPAGK